MKINIVKSLIALGLSLLLGLLCFAIAGDAESRNWVSLSVTTVTSALCLCAAFGCDYNCGARNANMKVLSWLGSIIVIITNFIFSCCEYNILIYLTITLLLTLILIASVYGLYKPQEEK